DGGAWTGGKVAQWMAAKTGRPVHRQRGCEYLRRLTTSTGGGADEGSGEGGGWGGLKGMDGQSCETAYPLKQNTKNLPGPLTTAGDPASVCAAGRKRAMNPNTAPSRQSSCKQPNGKRNNKEVTGGHMNNLDPRAQLLEGQTVAFVQALDAQGGSPIYTLTPAD